MLASSPIEITFTIPGEAVAWARAGVHGKVKFTPKKQASFMGAVKMFAARAMAQRAIRKPLEGPVAMRVTAIYGWPKSWPAKRRLAPGAVWKTSRSDADNIYKLVADSLNTIVYDDDAQVAMVVIEKKYGDTPALHVLVRSMGGAPP